MIQTAKGRSRPNPCCRLLILVLILFAPSAAVDAGTAPSPDRSLYWGQVIVTGQDNLAERQRGIQDALRQVLVKLSGDAGIARDPALSSVLPTAADLVASFRYRDRLKGVQVMDEQGTRERSQWLIVDFDPSSVHRVLEALGRRPWLADRPRLLVLLVIKDAAGAYVVGTRTKRGFGQREAFRQAANDLGLSLVLPQLVGTAGTAPTFEVISGRTAGEHVPRRELGTVLIGAMSTTATGKWRSDWVLLWRDTRVSWAVAETTFDRAIDAALAHSAARFAGIETGKR